MTTWNKNQRYDELFARTEHGTFRHKFIEPYDLKTAREVSEHLLRGHNEWFNVKLNAVDGIHHNTVR